MISQFRHIKLSKRLIVNVSKNLFVPRVERNAISKVLDYRWRVFFFLLYNLLLRKSMNKFRFLGLGRDD